MTITFQDGELRQLLREHTQTTQPGLLDHEQDQTLIFSSWLGSGHKRDIELPNGISLTLHQYQLNQELVNVCKADTDDCFEGVGKIGDEFHDFRTSVYCPTPFPVKDWVGERLGMF